MRQTRRLHMNTNEPTSHNNTTHDEILILLLLRRTPGLLHYFLPPISLHNTTFHTFLSSPIVLPNTRALALRSGSIERPYSKSGY